MSDLPVHRVAVTVFATVPAVNDADAAKIAERAIIRAIWSANPDTPGTLPYTVRGEPRPVEVHLVMETGCALMGGHLRIAPSQRPFPRSDNA